MTYTIAHTRTRTHLGWCRHIGTSGRTQLDPFLPEVPWAGAVLGRALAARIAKARHARSRRRA